MIKKLLLSLTSALLLLAGGAAAQPTPSVNGPFFGPNWSLGYVPTPQEWQRQWTNKVGYYTGGIPIVYGGTGATSAAAALTNLGGMSNALTPGALFVGNASGIATARALSGDATLSNVGAISVTKTNGVLFGAFATGTDAANLTGTVSVNRFNSGSGASSSTFLRGDGTWVNPTAAGITVGSTTVTGGTDTRVLRVNGSVLGEYTITGTGTVVAMQTSPSFTTPSLGAATGTSLTLGTPTGGSEGSGTLNLAAYLYQNGNITVADVPTFSSGFALAPIVPSLTSSSTGGHGECSGSYGLWIIGIGKNAASSLTNGCKSIAIGYNAFNAAVHDSASIAIGPLALQVMNGGDANTAIGYQSMGALTGASIFNVGVGNSTMEQHTSGSYNTAVGAHSMLAGLTGDENTGFGNSALYAVSGGNRNTAVGSDAASALVAANDVVAIGRRALYALVSGDGNVGIGLAAMQAQTSGSGNTGVGYQVLINNVTGAGNSAVGDHALYNATTSTDTVAVGRDAGYGVGGTYTATGNTLVGKQAGYSIATGTAANVFVGNAAGYGATTGAQNVIVGASSSSAGLNQLTTGSQNISIGFDNALASATANGQLVIGNAIYGTGLTGTGSTISTAKIGILTKAPAVELDVAGTINASVNLSVAGKLITLGGNLTMTGAYNTTFAMPGAYTYTMPAATSTVATTVLGGTPGNVACYTATGVQDCGVAPVTSAGATSVFGNNTGSPAAPMFNTTLLLAGSVSNPPYSSLADPTSGMYFRTATVVNIAASGKRVAEFEAPGTLGYYLRFDANDTPTVSAQGATNVNLQLSGNGTSGVDILSNLTNVTIARFFSSGNSSVNYFTLTAALTTASPTLAAAGSDTDVGLTFNTKGAGKQLFQIGGVTKLDYGLTNASAWTVSSASFFTGAAAFSSTVTLPTGAAQLLFSTDLLLGRAAAANLRLGAADVDTAPVAQTISMQNVLAGGTSNIAGASITIAAGQGKGTGYGGSIFFKTSNQGSTGTTVNALQTAFQIGPGGSSNNYILVASNNTPSIVAQGSTNLNMQLSGNGATGVDVMTNNIQQYIARFGVHGAAGAMVNYWAINGNVTANPVELLATGSDSNISISLTPKGSGAVNVSTGIVHTPNATIVAAALTGTIISVNTATAPAIGSALALGGAAYALAVYNGVQWTVIGN